MAKIYTATAADGRSISYRDRKRWWWALSVVYPLLPFVGMAAHARQRAWKSRSGCRSLISYGLMPLLDALIGEDENNPPEAVVPQLEADRYYRWLTWATVPLHFVALIGCAWWVGTHDLSWWALLMLAYVAGTDSGLGLNTGARTRPQAQRRSSSGWRGWCWRCRPTAISPWSTAAATTAGCRLPKITPARAWARASTASRCVNCRAASAAPGAGVGALDGPRSFALEPGTTRCCSPTLITALLQVGLVIVFGWVMMPFLRDPQPGRLVAADLGQLRRALRTAAPAPAQRSVRGAAAAPLVEHQPSGDQPGHLPPAAPQRPPCLSVAALPVPASFRRPAPTAQRLLRHVPAVLCPAVVVPGHGHAPAGIAAGSRRPAPG